MILLKIICKSKNIKSASNLLQYTARYWAELIEEIESEGYEVDSADKHRPAQWIAAYKDGNEYEIEVSKYSDGSYEIVKSDLVGEIKASYKFKRQSVESSTANISTGIDAESTTDSVAANDIGYDSYRDARLEPSEDIEIFELEDIDETLELNLSKVLIEIHEDGSWDYDDESYPWVTTTISEEYEIESDVTSIVEDFDIVVEPYLPMNPGKYQISCDASLAYTISNVYNTSDGQIDTSDTYVEFLSKDSAIYNFKYSTVM